MTRSLTLKNRSRELKFFNQRLVSVTIILGAMAFILISRLLYLQIYQHNLYTTLSKQNQLSFIPIEPTRGLIYDRNGVLLAENIPVFSLDIIPDKVKHLSQTIAALQKLINISPDDINFFNKELKQKRRFEPVPLKIKLTPEEVARFAVNRWRFPGVQINARLMRYYPLGKTTAHVVGFMGRINADDLRTVNSANYSASNYIGKVGIEKFYESVLHGTVGYQQVEIDASGHVVRVLKHLPPISGDNIYLTIDSRLEKIAEQALGKISGAVVVIQPSTGEIMALVSHPSYNPNLFVRGISTAKYLALQNSAKRPLYNRAIRGLYSPGSVIKPFYGLEGLESGVITPQSAFDDHGYFKYANHTFRNWYHSGFGWVSLEQAITVSDDPFFYNLAVLLGIKRIDNVLHTFGFGEKTNIEMAEELPGVVPTPQWKKNHLGHSWYTGDTINVGIGQGYLLVTPMQIAQATAILAMRGVHYQPHLILKIAAPNNMITLIQPMKLSTVTMPITVWDFIIHAMQDVITNPQGTGSRFFRDTPYTIAAKTGTTQVYTIYQGSHYSENTLPVKYQDNHSFIAFAPIKDPQITVCVVTEHSEIAAIVARKVIDYYLLKSGDTTQMSTS